MTPRTFTCREGDWVIEFPNGETWLFCALHEPFGWWHYGRPRINEEIRRQGRGLRRLALEGEVARDPRPAKVAAQAKALATTNYEGPRGCHPTGPLLAATGG